MDSFASIIDGLGGYLKVAEGICVRPKSVSSMRTRNSVPPEHWPALARFASASGRPEITVDALAALRPPRRVPQQPRQPRKRRKAVQPEAAA